MLGGRLRDIRQAKSRMFRLLSEQVVRMVQLQFIVSVVLFLLCLILLPRVGMSGLVMTIYPCMAAGYFALFLMYSVMLYLQYFNDLTGCVLTGGLFCAAVLAGSILCLQLPAYWYALGVFAGSVLGFSFAYFRVRWVERHLDEHIFCRGSLLQEKREPMPSAAVYTWLSQEEDAHEA